MKIKLTVSILIIVVTIIAVSSINSYATAKTNKIKSMAPYVLKAKDDHIAVYKLDELVREFEDVNYNTLPEYDRNTLKKGLIFDTIEEVYQTIEDFDG